MGTLVANAPPAWLSPVSPAVALTWAIEFAEGMRGATDFVRASVPAVRGMNRRQASPTQPADAEAVAQLRLEVSAMLSALATGSDFVFEPRVRLRLSRPRYTDAGDLVETQLGADTFVQVAGPLRDVFMFKLMRIVEAAGADLLRQCPSPPCSRLFVRRGRQEYCSNTCKMRRYMRVQRLDERKRRHELGIRRRRAGNTRLPMTPKVTPKPMDAHGRGRRGRPESGQKSSDRVR